MDRQNPKMVSQLLYTTESSEEELETLPLAFPEERPFLLDVVRKAGETHGSPGSFHDFGTGREC